MAVVSSLGVLCDNGFKSEPQRSQSKDTKFKEEKLSKFNGGAVGEDKKLSVVSDKLSAGSNLDLATDI